MAERNPKTTVFILSTIATIIIAGISIGIIYLFRYVESTSSPLPNYAWGIISISLCFLFAFFYMVGYKIYEKRAIHEDSLKE